MIKQFHSYNNKYRLYLYSIFYSFHKFKYDANFIQNKITFYYFFNLIQKSAHFSSFLFETKSCFIVNKSDQNMQ